MIVHAACTVHACMMFVHSLCVMPLHVHTCTYVHSITSTLCTPNPCTTSPCVSVICSAPDSVPEMLLAAHKVIMSTLDYLVVAQCASLLHQVFIPQDDILQMPWVQGVLASRSECSSLVFWTATMCMCTMYACIVHTVVSLTVHDSMCINTLYVRMYICICTYICTCIYVAFAVRVCA